MKRMFLLFALSVFFCLPFPAVAQEPVYTVTETELIRLESISENLKISRQNLLLQASDLTERLKAQEKKAKSLTEKLQKAESTANTLNSQLKTERDTLKNLRASYSAYEKEAAQKMAEMQTVIDKQKDKIHRLTATAITLLTALSMAIVFIVIKLKRFFPFLL